MMVNYYRCIGQYSYTLYVGLMLVSNDNSHIYSLTDAALEGIKVNIWKCMTKSHTFRLSDDVNMQSATISTPSQEMQHISITEYC